MKRRFAIVLLYASAAGCFALQSSSKKPKPEATQTKSAAPEEKIEETKEALPEGDAPEGPVSIAAGEFWFGKHKVTLDAFEVDRFEITAAEYNACVAKKACTAPGLGGNCTGGDPGKNNHPINCVTWAQAKKYCETAGKRLPTEAEWERAARGTSERAYPWGDSWPPGKGSGNFSDETARKIRPFWNAIDGYDDRYPETAPIGSTGGTSSDGAGDLAGNVMEWTQDYWDKLTKAAPKNPKGPTRGEGRVVRGSSYGHYRKIELAVTYRAGYKEDVASEHIGFRCAK
jgi:formylglycine-generating enzyme required for sulfatase activity